MVERLDAISSHDDRQTFENFYYTFDLQQFYTDGMIHLILSKKREPRNKAFIVLLEKCLTVYESNTEDYSLITDKQLAQARDAFNQKHPEQHLTAEMLGRDIGSHTSGIRKSMMTYGRYTCYVWDMLQHDLVTLKVDKNSFTNNINAYLELKARLMRAEINDGTRILTPSEVATQSGIDPEIIYDLSIACHDSNLYLDTYGKLVSMGKPYAIQK